MLLACVVKQEAASCVLVIDGRTAHSLHLDSLRAEASLGCNYLVVTSAGSLVFWALTAQGSLQRKAAVECPCEPGQQTRPDLQPPAISPNGHFLACSTRQLHDDVQLLLLDARTLPAGTVQVSRHAAAGSLISQTAPIVTWVGPGAAWRLDIPDRDLLGSPQQHSIYVQASMAIAPQRTPAQMMINLGRLLMDLLDNCQPQEGDIFEAGAALALTVALIVAWLMCIALYVLVAMSLMACIILGLILMLPMLGCISGRLAAHQAQIMVHHVWRCLIPADTGVLGMFCRPGDPNTQVFSRLRWQVG